MNSALVAVTQLSPAARFTFVSQPSIKVFTVAGKIETHVDMLNICVKLIPVRHLLHYVALLCNNQVSDNC
jgi:hypothetical protein